MPRTRLTVLRDIVTILLQSLPIATALSHAVGKWKIRDIVPSKEQFVYGHPKCPDAENSVWSEVYFPEGGEPYWFLEGWTKGFLYLKATIPEPHIVANPYSIECWNGHTIMFLEIPRRYADGSRDAVPQLLVFEKINSTSRKLQGENDKGNIF